MSTTEQAGLASRARRALVLQLEEAGIDASSDAGSFRPQPIGVLVGLPTLAGRGLASNTYTVPVLVVSADPLNFERVVDRLYALADDAAFALRCDSYRPSEWRPSSNSEALPALELTATVTLTIEEELIRDE